MGAKLIVFYAAVAAVIVYNIDVPGKTSSKEEINSAERSLLRKKYARLLDGGDTDSPTTSPIEGGPTPTPTLSPTFSPTFSPTQDPTIYYPPTTSPTTETPTFSPTDEPSFPPTISPTTPSPTPAPVVSSFALSCVVGNCILYFATCH